MARERDQRYFRITVGAVLDTDWSDRLSPLKVVEHGSGRTIVAGVLPDQAALHGIFRVLQSFGLEILEVLSDPIPQP